MIQDIYEKNSINWIYSFPEGIFCIQRALKLKVVN